MAQVIINIDDPAWSEQDIAEELREVANAIEQNESHGGITFSGNCWNIND